MPPSAALPPKQGHGQAHFRNKEKDKQNNSKMTTQLFLFFGGDDKILILHLNENTHIH